MAHDEGVLINDEAQMTNDEGMMKSEAQKPGSADDSFRNGDTEWVIREEPEKKRVYDLEERTARFGEAVIDFATSVGANSVEADDSVSKKDFLKSIGTCRKEARETSISSA